MSIILRAIAATALLAAPAGAATFTITMAGQMTTFDAPAAGGPISNFSISISGVTYDTPLPGALAPVYDAVENDIQGALGLFGNFENSAAGPGCPVASCSLEFEDSFDGMPPKLWAAYPLEMGIPGEVTGSGEYMISAGPDGVVPLPASVFFLGAALAALGVTSRRRRKTV